MLRDASCEAVYTLSRCVVDLAKLRETGEMYRQLEDAFGWEAYRKVFTEYRALPRHERPKTDEERRNQWLIRFSRTVGRNLGPFFESWAIPVSAEARRAVANLPVWMPR